MTLGSLFDGIGGSLLSATMCGIDPVWASEIEPFPIKVTEYHFPNVKHLGDITKIKGDEIEPVDIIVGGSPCQDLSVAGKRAGMKHADFGDDEVTRSGLFMEQIRIIKEMRNADKLRIERLSDTKIRGRSGTDNTSGKGGVCGDIRNTDAISADSGEGGATSIESGITQHGLCGASQHVRPRYMVWENVPGAFSSNDGEDFRAVLEETARVADPTISIPRSVNGWANAGSILADGFTISWRTFDAQYWGVPQRRRRIYLVADFGGQSAPEILFESEGVSRDIEEGRGKGQGTAEDVERSVGGAIAVDAYNHSLTGGVAVTFTAASGSSATHSGPMVLNDQGGSFMDVSDKVATLRAEMHGNIPSVYYGIDQQGGKSGANYTENISPTILSDSHGTPHAVCYGISAYESNSMKSSNPHSGIYEADTARTLDQNGGNPACNQGSIAICFEPRSPDGVPRICGDVAPTLNTAQGGQRQPCVGFSFQRSDELKESEVASTQLARQYKDATDLVVASVDCRNFRETPEHGKLQAKENGGQSLNYSRALRNGKTVRRLTPKECERLQGYPDGYTNIPGASDSARYKALGNSFAIPNIYFVIKRIKEVSHD